MSQRKKSRSKDVDTHVYETRLEGWGRVDLPLCAYCGLPFERGRIDQKFGNPPVERHLNWERKEKLIQLVADLLLRLGGRALNMLRVARLCVEAACDAVFRAVIALGYKYDQKRKVWRLATVKAQPA